MHSKQPDNEATKRTVPSTAYGSKPTWILQNETSAGLFDGDTFRLKDLVIASSICEFYFF